MADLSNLAQSSFQLKDIVEPLVTLVATFSGAWFAFWLPRCAGRDETARQIGAFNRALIVLFNMHGSLETYKQDVIDPFARREDGWLNAPVKPARVWTGVRIDYDGLAFLLEKREPNLYAELLLCEANFDEIDQLIRQRDDVVFSRVHPALSKFLGRLAPEDEVCAAVGPHAVQQLKQFWDAIKERVVQQIATTERLHDSLRDATVRIHPGGLPIKAVFFADDANKKAGSGGHV